MNSYKCHKEKKPPYSEGKPNFQGWYFKHQCSSDTIVFIVGRNVGENGAGSAFIQVITEYKSYNVNFPISDFHFMKKGFGVIVGKNFFTSKGMYVDIDSGGLILKGKVYYGQLTPLSYPIMGPFQYLPKMECQHEIISLHHRIHGFLRLNGKDIDFENGVGYIEADAGCSFPKSYMWMQCNDFRYAKCGCSEHTSRLTHKEIVAEEIDKKLVKPPKACIMASMAQIQYLKMNFKGVICVVYFKEKQYRLATYLGVKLEFFSDNCVVLKQGKYKLVIKLCDSKGQKLLAPKNGNMSRLIEESLLGKGKFWFYEGEKLIFALESDRCSYERVK